MQNMAIHDQAPAGSQLATTPTASAASKCGSQKDKTAFSELMSVLLSGLTASLGNPTTQSPNTSGANASTTSASTTSASAATGVTPSTKPGVVSSLSAKAVGQPSLLQGLEVSGTLSHHAETKAETSGKTLEGSAEPGKAESKLSTVSRTPSGSSKTEAGKASGQGGQVVQPVATPSPAPKSGVLSVAITGLPGTSSVGISGQQPDLKNQQTASESTRNILGTAQSSANSQGKVSIDAAATSGARQGTLSLAEVASQLTSRFPNSRIATVAVSRQGTTQSRTQQSSSVWLQTASLPQPPSFLKGKQSSSGLQTAGTQKASNRIVVPAASAQQMTSLAPDNSSTQLKSTITSLGATSAGITTDSKQGQTAGKSSSSHGDATTSSVNMFAASVSAASHPFETGTQLPALDTQSGSVQQHFAQLVQQQVQNNVQTLQVKLYPEGMGTITVAVHHVDTGIAVQVSAANQATAAWLQQDSPQLVQSLQNAGIQVASLQVGLGQQQGGAPQQQGRQEKKSPNSVSRVSDTRGVQQGTLLDLSTQETVHRGSSTISLQA